MFAAANFGVEGNQTVSIPSVGTWYDYLGNASEVSGTVTLKPGELKIYTGSPLIKPTFKDINKRDHTPIEMVQETNAPKAYKFLRNGQVLISRGDKVYNLQGQLVE